MIRPQTLVITGPTASGKTQLALELAQALPCEIISADSALVYRHMDIGTAKPTPQERALAPHHLIDIVEPTQSYSTASFITQVQDCIQAIHQRQRHAIVVGGTLLYIKTWLYGLDELPPSTPEVRQSIQEQAKKKGWPALHQTLMQIDPITAQRLSVNDQQRIGRALEVYQMTSLPLSHFHTHHVKTPRIPMLSLEPQERTWLHQRIVKRTNTMWQQGFVNEWNGLLQRYPELDLQHPSMRCVGYRQAFETLEKTQAPSLLNTPHHQALWQELTVIATRQLAKRQMTWLRSLSRHVIAADLPNAIEKAQQKALELLTTPNEESIEH